MTDQARPAPPLQQPPRAASVPCRHMVAIRTVARTSGAWRVSAATNSRSITESSGRRVNQRQAYSIAPPGAGDLRGPPEQPGAIHAALIEFRRLREQRARCPKARRPTGGRRPRPQAAARNRSQRRGKPGYLATGVRREAVGRNRAQTPRAPPPPGPRLRRGCAPRSRWAATGRAPLAA
jgi:hypothetical protein